LLQYKLSRTKTQINFKKVDNPVLIESGKMFAPEISAPTATLNEMDRRVLKVWDESLGTNFDSTGKASLATVLVSLIFSNSTSNFFLSLSHVSLFLFLKNVKMNTNSPIRRQPFVVGHRGSLYQYPENTVRSFLASYEEGCDAIELDVFLLKCGTLVVFHGGGTDENPGLLEDYCNIKGSILDYTAKEARGLLKLNPHYEEFACPTDRILDQEHTYIPTLEEVLLALKGTNMIVKIELKGEGTTVPVLSMVKKLDMVNQCHYSSFDHSRIALVRKLHPEKYVDGTHMYKTGALFADNLPQDFVRKAKSIGASEVHLKYDTCTKERVDQIHKAGMESMCWFRGPIGMNEDVEEKYNDVGNEDFRMYEIVRRTGVRAMCVNKPAVLVKLLSINTAARSDAINFVESTENFTTTEIIQTEIFV